MRLDARATDSEKANFAIKAWLEADAIELALNKHTCTIERAFIFQAREYIFKYVHQYLLLSLLLITPQHKDVYILRISALHPTCYCVCLLILWEPKRSMIETQEYERFIPSEQSRRVVYAGSARPCPFVLILNSLSNTSSSCC
jgi:hypothetical protein